MQEDTDREPIAGSLDQVKLDREKLSEAIRFMVTAGLGIADRIKEVEQLKTQIPENREENPNSIRKTPDNILDANYERPWWTVMFGLGGLYLGYLLFGRSLDGSKNRTGK